MLVTSAGIIVADIIAVDLPKVSDPGELVFTGRNIEIHNGGHATNVSIDLRKLDLKKGEVSSVGAIGDDIFGDYIENLLGEHGVLSHLQRIKGVSTSKDLILVVKGQDRRYHVDVGANWHLSPDHVLSVLDREKPLIFYVGGVGFMGEFDEKLPGILQKAKDRGCLTFVDPVAPYRHGWDIVLPGLPWADIFHCNNFEAEKVTSESNLLRAAKALLDKGAKFVIISLGGDGLIAMTRKTIFRMPAFQVPVVDPSGAGDAFCAGVMHGLARVAGQEHLEINELSDDELAHVLLEGEAAGAACVTMVGTTTAVTKANVERLLNAQGSTVLEQLRVERP